MLLQIQIAILLLLLWYNEVVYGLCGTFQDVSCCSLKSDSLMESGNVKYPCTVCPTCEKYTDYYFISNNKSAFLLRHLSTESMRSFEHTDEFFKSTYENYPGYCKKRRFMEGSEAVFACSCPKDQTLKFPDYEELYISSGLLEQEALDINAPRLQKIYFCESRYQSTGFSSNTKDNITQISIHYSPIDFQIFINWAIPFTSLRTLNLSHSYFTTLIKANRSITLTSVQNLDLSFCSIEYINLDMFTAFPEIIHLNLSYNKIKSFSSNSFIALKNLMFVKLIKSLEIRSIAFIFHREQRINMVDLSQNRIRCLYTEFDIANGPKLLNGTQNITFEQDTLNSDCNIPSCLHKLGIKPVSFNLSAEKGGNCKKVCGIDEDCEMNIVLFRSKRSNKYALKHPMEKTVAWYDKKSDKRDPLHYVPVAMTAVLLLLAVIVIFIYCCDAPYFFRRILKNKMKRLSVSSECYRLQYDIFVTFSVGDREWVSTVFKQILETISDKNHIILHERDQLIGVDRMESAYKSINPCSKWIMILTNDFIQSQQCQSELQLARTRLSDGMKNFLMLIELETLDTNNIPPYLKQLICTQTYVEWNLKKFMENFLVNKVKIFLKEVIYQEKTNQLLEV